MGMFGQEERVDMDVCLECVAPVEGGRSDALVECDGWCYRRAHSCCAEGGAAGARSREVCV